MTERPILFNGDMVRAILRGQKTQTRRPVKPQPDMVRPRKRFDDARWKSWSCPLGKPGDRLWVRETFAYEPDFGVAYRADEGDEFPGMERQKWTPSIHMPRALSRITLEITDIRVERVQDISEEEARAEGIEALDGRFVSADLCDTARWYDMSMGDARCIYAHLWDALYAAYRLGWSVNPLVWVVTFKRVEDKS